MMYDLLARFAANVIETSTGLLNATWNVWRLSSERAERDFAPALESALVIVSRDQSPSSPQTGENLLTDGFDAGNNSAGPIGRSMYNLKRAKEEIDAVAKHATGLAAHVFGMSENIDVKLEGFKKQILSAIDARFSELERTVLGGDVHNMESSAVGDLGAQMSRLTQSAPAPTLDRGSIDTGDHHTGTGGHAEPHDDHHREQHDANFHGEHRHDDHSHDNHHQEYRG